MLKVGYDHFEVTRQVRRRSTSATRTTSSMPTPANARFVATAACPPYVVPPAIASAVAAKQAADDKIYAATVASLESSEDKAAAAEAAAQAKAAAKAAAEAEKASKPSLWDRWFGKGKKEPTAANRADTVGDSRAAGDCSDTGDADLGYAGPAREAGGQADRSRQMRRRRRAPTQRQRRPSRCCARPRRPPWQPLRRQTTATSSARPRRPPSRFPARRRPRTRTPASAPKTVGKCRRRRNSSGRTTRRPTRAAIDLKPNSKDYRELRAKRTCDFARWWRSWTPSQPPPLSACEEFVAGFIDADRERPQGAGAASPLAENGGANEQEGGSQPSSRGL